MTNNTNCHIAQRVPMDDLPEIDIKNIAIIGWNVGYFGEAYVDFDSPFMRAAMILVERGAVTMAVGDSLNGVSLSRRCR